VQRECAVLNETGCAENLTQGETNEIEDNLKIPSPFLSLCTFIGPSDVN
jgi:hypothetical protein